MNAVFGATVPANTGHSPYAVSMLGQRRRRWASIETALVECPVFAGTVVRPAVKTLLCISNYYDLL